jgi:hypothetical protein
MAQAIVLVVVCCTSAGALLVGTAWLGLRPTDLGAAMRRAVECVGLTLGFFGLNLAIGIGVVLAGRYATGTFISMYFANDIVLLGLSLLQGIACLCWRAAGRP